MVYPIRTQPSAKWASKGSIEDLCFVFYGDKWARLTLWEKKGKDKQSILHQQIQQFKGFFVFYAGSCTVWLTDNVWLHIPVKLTFVVAQHHLLWLHNIFNLKTNECDRNLPKAWHMHVVGLIKCEVSGISNKHDIIWYLSQSEWSLGWLTSVVWNSLCERKSS